MQASRLEKLKSLSQPFLRKLRKMVRPTGQVIGLDIGSRLIKMVQLRRLARGWQLLDVQVVEVKQEKEGMITRNGECGIETVLKRLIAETGTRGADVAVSLSGPSVMVKPIEVPLMTEAELEGHLEWEVERYLPYERADIYWDYYIPHRNQLSSSSSLTAYLVAAKKEIVDRKVELVKQAGLHPVIVDIDSVALLNMYTLNYEDSGQIPVLLVNLGPSGLNMIAVGISECIYIRDASIGGEWSQEVLEEGARLVRDGEVAKKEWSNQTKALDVLLQEMYGEIMNEMRRIIDHCNSSENDQPIQRVLLCGGYVHLPGFVDSLSLQLPIPVEVIDPFKNLMIAETAYNRKMFEPLSSVSGVAVGLALRGGQDQ